jgi:hypothetical protein
MKYAKSPVGLSAFAQRSPLFSARQRTAFILFDGKRSLAEVLASTQGIGVTDADLQYLIELGFVLAAEVPAPMPEAAPPLASESGASVEDSGASQQQRYQIAYPLATQLTARLGLRGFSLNLAIEAAGSYEDLVKLYPRIADAVGAEKAAPLARALGL